jgi:hypothetical protein
MNACMFFLAQAELGSKYMVLRPYVLDGYRNQNSLILARRGKFIEGSRTDLTEQICRFVLYVCVLKTVNRFDRRHACASAVFICMCAYWYATSAISLDMCCMYISFDMCLPQA